MIYCTIDSRLGSNRRPLTPLSELHGCTGSPTLLYEYCVGFLREENNPRDSKHNALLNTYELILYDRALVPVELRISSTRETQ